MLFHGWTVSGCSYGPTNLRHLYEPVTKSVWMKHNDMMWIDIWALEKSFVVLIATNWGAGTPWMTFACSCMGTAITYEWLDISSPSRGMDERFETCLDCIDLIRLLV